MPIEDVAKRYAAYLQAKVNQEISPHDGMFDPHRMHAMEHYMGVGRSAIEVIARAMIASGKTVVHSVLDLPCGAGRVARHLRAFFPESEFFVSDLDERLEAYSASAFGANRFEAPRDFATAASRSFDLIFVGSLVTHFDDAKFRRAVAWYVDALAPDGLLVLTTHGRQHDLRQRRVRQWIPPEEWEKAFAGFVETGFGYVAYPGQDYGLSVCRPSWLLALVENNSDLRIVAFEEACWNQHHDVLTVQRRSLTGGPPILPLP